MSAAAEATCIPNGFYTITSPTGEHRTFRIHRVRSGQLAGQRVVGVLRGRDNEADYQEFGFVRNAGVHVWNRHRSSTSSARTSTVSRRAATVWTSRRGACDVTSRSRPQPLWRRGSVRVALRRWKPDMPAGHDDAFPDLDNPDKFRPCGSCKQCCKLLRITELDSPAGQWCRYADPLGDHGCTVVGTSDRPVKCGVFNCLWRCGMGDESERPDRTRVVFSWQPSAVQELRRSNIPCPRGVIGMHVQTAEEDRFPRPVRLRVTAMRDAGYAVVVFPARAGESQKILPATPAAGRQRGVIG